MFWNDEIHMQTSRMRLLDILRDYSPRASLRIETNAASFKLYDAFSKRNWRIFHYFVIAGSVIEVDDGIIVKYSIRPALASSISAFIMLFSMLFVLSISGELEMGKWISLILIAANICYFIDLVWQTNAVKARFEQILQA